MIEDREGVRTLRKLKFRMYSKEYGMSPGCSIFDIQIADSEGLTDMSRVEIMRYTESTDDERNEIYEDDIVSAYKWRDKDNSPMVNMVYFRNGCFMWGNWTWLEFLNHFRYREVIGNIHDNPELMKESDCDAKSM